MKEVHKNWEPTGRTLEQQEDDGTPTGRMVWEGFVNQKCLYYENEWKPYTFIPALNKLFFRDEEALEFSDTQEKIWHKTKEIVKSSKFFVQEKVGEAWENRPHGKPTKNLQHDFPKQGRCTAYLDFPNAQYDLRIGFEVGLHRFSKFGFRFRAPKSGQVRFQWVLDGINKLPKDYEWLYTGSGKLGFFPEKRKIGIKFKDIIIHWLYKETPQRSFNIETNPNDTKKLTITFGPYDYVKNTSLEVTPDTWGLTENSDDCFELDDTTYYDYYYYGGKNVLFAGCYASNHRDCGHTWTNVTATGTANDGCYVKVDDSYIHSGTPQVNMRAVDARDVTAWSATYRPRTHATLHAASVAWDNICDSSPDNSPEIKTLIQARFDDDHVSGDDIGIVFLDKQESGTNLAYYNAEEEGTSGAKLKIVYTPAAAGNPWWYYHLIGKQ